MSKPWRLLAVALVLILGGDFLAWEVQTAGGTVRVRDIRWVAPSGTGMSGLLYIPEGVTADNPAPGILAIHGYINSRETQDGFAIEFARRGYVVLAIDQTGHGYSDPPAFAEGFGGPAGLAYLRSLAFVDTANIGLEGHSMGGWAADAAAAAYPDGYDAMVLAGSSTGAFGAPAGGPEFPRNLALIFSRWDEFAQTMWGIPAAAEVATSDALRAVFGTDDIQIGQLYGSIGDGTGRMLFQPRTNHPGDHLSRTAIGNAIEWFGMTLDGESERPASDQIWYWKEFGNLLGAIGMILLLFPVGALLLRTHFFAELADAPPESGATRGATWWVTALVTLALGPLTLLPFKSIPDAIGWAPSAWFPQSITNAVVAWVVALAILTVALVVPGHYLARKRPSPANPQDAYGLTWNGGFDWRRIGKSLVFALLVVGAGYVTLVLTSTFFHTDFRFWVFAIKPMSPLQLRMAVVYFFPFALYFLALDAVVFARLRREEWSLARATAVNVGILTLGWIGFYLYQYSGLLGSGTMTIADEPLWTIISYQLLPLMIIAGLALTYFNRATGRIYAGSFVVSLLVAWIVVASQATQFAI